MLNDMKLYELEIQDENIDEVFAISMVEAGAIESDWIAFDKEEVAFAKVDTEQRMVIGAILIPNKRIMRIDGEGQPYEVFFSPQTIKKLSHNYLMKKYQDKVTLEHDKKIKGVTLVESWIKEGKLDKSNNYGLNLPMGSWIGIMKITDDKIWNDYVKTGKTNGFSIEGSFEHKLVHYSKDELFASSMLEKIKGIILESYPSLSNPTYSGETPTSGSEFISPAIFAEGDVCPEATQNIPINLANRQKCIDEANYGPLDIKNPGDYWKGIADTWNVDEETARKETCGNCAAFNITQKVLDCIATGIGGNDKWDVVEAGSLGYCEFYDFKCNSHRTCLAHVDGGPITD